MTFALIGISCPQLSGAGYLLRFTLPTDSHASEAGVSVIAQLAGDDAVNPESGEQGTEQVAGISLSVQPYIHGLGGYAAEGTVVNSYLTYS